MYQDRHLPVLTSVRTLSAAVRNLCLGIRRPEGLRHELVIACFGLTVNVALMLAGSPVLISPAQPWTL